MPNITIEEIEALLEKVAKHSPFHPNDPGKTEYGKKLSERGQYGYQLALTRVREALRPKEAPNA